MALWFPIMVNNSWVGQLELVRIDPVDHKPVQDEWCTYRLKYYDQQHTLKVDKELSFPYKEADPVPLLHHALESILL